MTTFTITTNIPQPMEVVSEITHSYDNEQHPIDFVPNHPHHFDSMPSYNKDFPFTDDESQSNEEYENDDSHIQYHKSMWPHMFDKRSATKVIRGGNLNGNGGDSRLWAIPYRFGKRSAMPYRFGKRAGMHFRLGKKSASL